MNPLESIKKQIADNINKSLGKKLIEKELIVYPPQKEMGDLSLPCFELAKTAKKAPTEIALELKEKLNFGKEISEIKVVGPYLNFFVKKQLLIEKVLKEIQKEKDKYGNNKNESKGKIMVEYSNVNTHKQYHVGHLRNICYGDSINKILKANGNKAIPVSYINDFGIHVAKTLWWLYHKDNAHAKKTINNSTLKNKGYFLGETYVKSSQKIKEYKNSKDEISKLMKSIETGQGENYKKWEKTRMWSINEFEKIYKDLNIKFDNYFYESDYIKEGFKIVKRLLKEGILEESEGAVIANLEKYDLGVLVILRTDGTATYPVADLALASAKIKKYKLDKSIYIVDDRQSLYFKQLFKILKLMGHKQNMVHLGYDFVKLPSGMMSSRSGNVITYKELKDKILNYLKEETKKRHSDWSEKKVEKTAWKIGLGAIKFEMIKINAHNIITFDIKKALSFEGFTSAYIQYTYARINSIIKKSKVSGKKVNFDPKELKEEKEFGLAFKLARYPEIVKRAGNDYDPSEIARYLFELAQSLNDYYHSIPVLKAEDKIKKARLELLRNSQSVIENGLSLMGIEVIEEM